MPIREHLRNPRQLHPATEFAPALADQLTDVHALKADAERRGWTDEAQRHDRVAHALNRGWDSEVTRHARLIASLQRHIDRLKRDTPDRPIT